jgi:hypothetical protein
MKPELGQIAGRLGDLEPETARVTRDLDGLGEATVDDEAFEPEPRRGCECPWCGNARMAAATGVRSALISWRLVAPSPRDAPVAKSKRPDPQ